MESRIFMPFHSAMHKEPAQEHSSANFQKSMTCKVRTSADPEMVCRWTWSDSVSYNETGTEISLVQRKNSKTSRQLGSGSFVMCSFCLLSCLVELWKSSNLQTQFLCRLQSHILLHCCNLIGKCHRIHPNQSKAAAFGQECCFGLCYSVLVSFWNILNRLSICIGLKLQLFWSQAGSVLMTCRDLFVEESPKVARLDATKIRQWILQHTCWIP